MTTLERLKELNEKATPGRWDHDLKANVFTAYDPLEFIDECDKAFLNASLIVEMRNALPKLLAVVDALNESGLMAPSVRAALEALDSVQE